MSSSVDSKCPICLNPNLNDMMIGLICPTNVWWEVGDLRRLRPHYIKLITSSYEVLAYPPYQIYKYIGQTDIYHGYAPNQQIIASLPFSLNLPWNKDEEIRKYLDTITVFS